MGGTVAETIRKENGEIIKMARKTGAYNWMFFSKKFNTGQIDLAIEEHVQIFKDMKKDYETGEPYVHPMTPAYGWCNHIAPVGYGLVVIDMQNKHIHSMQNYDKPGTIHFINLFLALKNLEKDDPYEFLLLNNLLNVHDSKNNKIGDIESVIEKFNNVKDIYNLLEKINKDSYVTDDSNSTSLNSFSQFSLKSLENFEFIYYDNTPQSSLTYIQNLVNDGFTFNQEEADMWKKHINNYENDMFINDETLSSEDFEQQAEVAKTKLLKDVDLLFNLPSKSLMTKP